MRNHIVGALVGGALLSPWLSAQEAGGGDNYKIELPSHLRMHPVFHISRLKPAIPAWKPAGYTRDLPGSPPAIDTHTGQQFAEIESIIRARYLRPPYGTSRAIRPPEYLVKWKNEPVHAASWRKEEELRATAPRLLDEYLSTLPTS